MLGVQAVYIDFRNRYILEIQLSAFRKNEHLTRAGSSHATLRV